MAPLVSNRILWVIFFYAQGHKWKIPAVVGCDPRASSANIPVRFLKEYF